MSSSETRAEAGSDIDRSTVPDEGISGPATNDDMDPRVRHLFEPTTGRRLKLETVLVWLGRIAVFWVVVLIWNLIVELEWIERLFIATPREVGSWLLDAVTDGGVWSDAKVTLREAVTGWAIGASLAILVALGLARFETLNGIFSPYLIFANAVPKVILAPMFILWFGLGEMSKIVLVITIVFFIVQVPTQSAVKLIDEDLVTLAQTMGATEMQRFRKVVVPGVMPSILGALRLGAVWALLGAAFGEILGTRAGGLGERYISAHNLFDMDQAFGTTVILASLALVLNGVIGVIERRLLRWQRAGRSAQLVSF